MLIHLTVVLLLTQRETPSPADAAVRVDMLRRLGDLIRPDVLGFCGLFVEPYGLGTGDMC